MDICSSVSETRGDVYTFPEDEFNSDIFNDTLTEEELPSTPTTPTTPITPTTPTDKPVTSTEVTQVEETTTGSPVTEESPGELCNRKPFDAFTNLKNGTIYAFRGKETLS